MSVTDFRIKHLYLSPGHNFFGRHEQPPGEHPMIECSEVRALAGRGLEGDRFMDFKRDYKGQVTFFAFEVYEELCNQLGIRDRLPSVFRRNIITQGVDLNGLIGAEFEVQGVRFAGTGECMPCYWMDRAFGKGAEEALQNRGGLRARVLSDGVLRVDQSE